MLFLKKNINLFYLSFPRYVIEHSGADILVVEGEKELAKIVPYRHELKGVKAIVQYLGESEIIF